MIVIEKINVFQFLTLRNIFFYIFNILQFNIYYLVGFMIQMKTIVCDLCYIFIRSQKKARENSMSQGLPVLPQHIPLGQKVRLSHEDKRVNIKGI